MWLSALKMTLWWTHKYKTRFSGHLLSRLSRGASQHNQTKGLATYMKGKQSGNSTEREKAVEIQIRRLDQYSVSAGGA